MRFHAGTSEVMARVLLLDRQELEPGASAFARFRLEAPLVAMPDDRFVIRSYSPMVTIGGGALLDIAPPRFKRKGPALVAHLTLLREGRPEAVVEEHVRHAGVGGVRLAALSGRVPFGPERLRGLLDTLRLGLMAKDLGLDEEDFNRCLTGREMKPFVERSAAEARALGVQGTPAFFIDGVAYEGRLTYEQLAEAVAD